MKNSGQCSQKSFIKRMVLPLLVMRCILLFIGKNINLFTREGACHSTILPFLLLKNLLLKDTQLTYVIITTTRYFHFLYMDKIDVASLAGERLQISELKMLH